MIQLDLRENSASRMGRLVEATASEAALAVFELRSSWSQAVSVLAVASSTVDVARASRTAWRSSSRFFSAPRTCPRAYSGEVAEIVGVEEGRSEGALATQRRSPKTSVRRLV